MEEDIKSEIENHQEDYIKEPSNKSTAVRVKKLKELSVKNKFRYTINTDVQFIPDLRAFIAKTVIDITEKDGYKYSVNGNAYMSCNDKFYGKVAVQWAETASIGRAIFKTGIIDDEDSLATLEEVNYNERELTPLKRKTTSVSLVNQAIKNISPEIPFTKKHKYTKKFEEEMPKEVPDQEKEEAKKIIKKSTRITPRKTKKNMNLFDEPKFSLGGFDINGFMRLSPVRKIKLIKTFNNNKSIVSLNILQDYLLPKGLKISMFPGADNADKYCVWLERAIDGTLNEEAKKVITEQIHKNTVAGLNPYDGMDESLPTYFGISKPAISLDDDKQRGFFVAKFEINKLIDNEKITSPEAWSELLKPYNKTFDQMESAWIGWNIKKGRKNLDFSNFLKSSSPEEIAKVYLAFVQSFISAK